MNNMPWFGNSSDGLVLDFSTRPDNHGEFSDLPRPGTPPGFTIWVYQSATITNIGESSPAIGAVTDLGVVETDKAKETVCLRNPKLQQSLWSNMTTEKPCQSYIYIYRYSHLRPIWPIDSRWFPSHVWWQWRLFQPFGSTELHHPMAFVFYLGKWLAIEAPKQKRIEAHSKNI